MGQAWNWKTAKGAVAVRQEDYGFYANRRFGTWQTAWRDAYDGIKVNSRGATREKLDGLISNAVRKNSMRELNQFNFATPEAKKAVVDSIKVLQDLLPAIGKEGRAKGVLRNRVDNYLPRLWLRDKVESNKEEFIKLLEKKIYSELDLLN